MSQHTSESNCVFITIALSVITDRLMFTEYLYSLITAASIYKGCSHASFYITCMNTFFTRNSVI